MGSRKRLGQHVRRVELGVDLAQGEDLGGDSIMNEVLTKIDVFGPSAAANRAFRPRNAALIIFVDWRGSQLRKTQRVKQLPNRNHLLN